MTASLENTYSYLNNKQTVEETNSTISMSGDTQIRQIRFSTSLSGDKPESVVQEYLSGDNWVKKEEFVTSYNAEGNPLREELKKYTELTQTPVTVYKTEWQYKPGAGVDTYTTYAYDESISQTVKSWSFAVFYPGDGSTGPEGLEKTELNKKSQLFVYPNPAYENIFISEENQESGSPVQYAIYSMTGRLQKKGVINTPQEEISVSTLASGNYVLRLTKDGIHSSCVFVKR
jgi:hypothetical protein